VRVLLRFAGQWVAGQEMDEALDRTVAANRRKMGGILNYLGEHYQDKPSVEAACQEYRQLLEAIRSRGLDASISIKLSQCGLEVDLEYCRQKVAHLATVARERGVFLWFDMEQASLVPETLAIYQETLETYSRTGVCVQANLRRTEDDVKSLLSIGAKIRLTKGAYRPTEASGFLRQEEIDENYLVLLRSLFEHGDNFAVATHDGALIQETLHLAEIHHKTFEFQMLLGVRDPLKRELLSRGFTVNEYIPYGPQWLPYFARRLRERPRNIVTMFQSFLQG